VSLEERNQEEGEEKKKQKKRKTSRECLQERRREEHTIEGRNMKESTHASTAEELQPCDAHFVPILLRNGLGSR
jgi:hypothetical protein